MNGRRGRVKPDDMKNTSLTRSIPVVEDLINFMAARLYYNQICDAIKWLDQNIENCEPELQKKIVKSDEALRSTLASISERAASRLVGR